mmetsp:Transcript_58795/g.127835  ORF Transcript_58795/g.127835 Transcript_58795/m.127835 type:complete len:86 (-) Transcript_58795:824-1081(-)
MPLSTGQQNYPRDPHQPTSTVPVIARCSSEAVSLQPALRSEGKIAADDRGVTRWPGAAQSRSALGQRLECWEGRGWVKAVLVVPD